MNSIFVLAFALVCCIANVAAASSCYDFDSSRLELPIVKDHMLFEAGTDLFDTCKLLNEKLLTVDNVLALDGLKESEIPFVFNDAEHTNAERQKVIEKAKKKFPADSPARGFVNKLTYLAKHFTKRHLQILSKECKTSDTYPQALTNFIIKYASS